MHVGTTVGPGMARPMLSLTNGAAGAVSADGRVAGCYLHGLFASDAFRRAFVGSLGGVGDAGLAYEARIEATLDALAVHLEQHLDVAALLEIAHAR
jgi:adenosylcobyric acid synthase